jgi:tetratricopeptide (TPR) repeat protein
MNPVLSVLADAGELKNAIACMEQVYKEYPANFDVLRVTPRSAFTACFTCALVHLQLLGNYYCEAGDYKKARTLLKKVVRLPIVGSCSIDALLPNC